MIKISKEELITQYNCERRYFENTCLQRIRLNHTWLPNINLKGSDLRYSTLCDATLYLADLRGVDFRHADLRWCNLNEADLRGADLRGVDLSMIRAEEADFTGARLQNNVFSKHFIRRAILPEKELTLALASGSISN